MVTTCSSHSLSYSRSVIPIQYSQAVSNVLGNTNEYAENKGQRWFRRQHRFLLYLACINNSRNKTDGPHFSFPSRDERSSGVLLLPPPFPRPLRPCGILHHQRTWLHHSPRTPQGVAVQWNNWIEYASTSLGQYK